MDFDLSTDQIETREWARLFAEKEVSPFASKHSQNKISASLLEKLAENGFSVLLVPERLGGLGLDSVSFSLVMQEISKVCGSVGVTLAVTNMIADVLVREGSSFHHEKFLKRLVQRKALTASFCLTENSAGSDAGSLRSRAIRRGDFFEITGEKIYVTNGAFSDFFLVMARSLDVPGTKGVSAFMVERDSPGLSLGKEEDKMGLIGSSTIRLSFDQVRVPASHLLQEEGDGFKIAMRALDGGRISVASQALGIAKAAHLAGLQYAKQREAFSKPIAAFQAIQWKLSDAATQMEAAEQLVLQAASLKDRGLPFTLEASMAKLFTTEMAIRVCEDMLQIHGGYGYVKDYPVERFCRDVRVTTLYEGTSEIQRRVIARELLKA